MVEEKKEKMQPKTETEIAQEFVDEYQKLCERHGFQVVVTPAFKARDDGTWSVVLQSSVGRIPKDSK